MQSVQFLHRFFLSLMLWGNRVPKHGFQIYYSVSIRFLSDLVVFLISVQKRKIPEVKVVTFRFSGRGSERMEGQVSLKSGENEMNDGSTCHASIIHILI
jgi:hypothetical protein